MHRLWNNTAPEYINPFPFDKDYTITWHWYVHTILKDISYLSVLLAMWLYLGSNMKRERDILTAFAAVFMTYVIDLPHYLLTARHSELVLLVQGLILLVAALKILSRKLE